ncbi:melatonin receptor type 1A-like [Montipora capricornis]|uniref:melatonin receptor type 1A-like n=1 Tax=Montipora capricornis TaxID=246305 RepID=UPI0035F1E3BF
MTSEEVLAKVWINIDNAQTIVTTVAVLAAITFPMAAFGNVLVVLSVWRDPLRKLRSSPSNLIIFSMAVADLLVGLVASPLHAFWAWALLYKYTNASFGFLKFFATLINVSVGHILLLSIDMQIRCCGDSSTVSSQGDEYTSLHRFCHVLDLFFIVWVCVLVVAKAFYKSSVFSSASWSSTFSLCTAFTSIHTASKHWMTSMQAYLAK